MLHDAYDITQLTADVQPLLFVPPKLSPKYVQPVSISQRLAEAEGFILTLEGMISRYLDRERLMKVELIQLKAENLRFRVDVLNVDMSSADLSASNSVSTVHHDDLRSPMKTFPELNTTSNQKRGIDGLRYNGPANVMPSILDRLKNKIAGLSKYA